MSSVGSPVAQAEGGGGNFSSVNPGCGALAQQSVQGHTGQYIDSAGQYNWVVGASTPVVARYCQLDDSTESAHNYSERSQKRKAFCLPYNSPRALLGTILAQRVQPAPLSKPPTCAGPAHMHGFAPPPLEAPASSASWRGAREGTWDKGQVHELTWFARSNTLPHQLLCTVKHG